MDILIEEISPNSCDYEDDGIQSSEDDGENEELPFVPFEDDPTEKEENEKEERDYLGHANPEIQ